MDKTVTIRLPAAQHKALGARAGAQGKTRSQLIREFIDLGLEERPLARRIGHLKGRLEVDARGSGWRQRIKERNWR